MTTPTRHTGWVSALYVPGVLLVGSLAVAFVGMVAPEPSSVPVPPGQRPSGEVTPLPPPRVTAGPCFVAAGLRASCPRGFGAAAQREWPQA